MTEDTILDDDALASNDSFVERAYTRLKAMTITYEIKPGERLNEGKLASKLGVSRTPLREALNRLNIEGFLSFVPGRDFFCREFDAPQIFDLYELRKAIEVAAIDLAVKRAADAKIDEIIQFLDETGPAPGDRSTDELVKLDEAFHEKIMALSGNAEMMRVLQNINQRIQFVRWIDMERIDRRTTQLEHRNIVMAMKERNAELCRALLAKHIDRRLDQIVSAIKEGYAMIYMSGGQR